MPGSLPGGSLHGGHQAFFTDHPGPKHARGVLPRVEAGWQHAPWDWSPSLGGGSWQAWWPQPWHCCFARAGHRFRSCCSGRTRARAGRSARPRGLSGDKQMPQALPGKRDKFLNNLSASKYLPVVLVLWRVFQTMPTSDPQTGWLYIEINGLTKRRGLVGKHW